MRLMYEKSREREYAILKFKAGLAGVKIDDIQTVTDKDGNVTEYSADFVFGAPEDYENMSQEERQKMTDKMKGMHRKWASNAI